MDILVTKIFEYLPGILQTAGWILVLWGWWSLKRVFVRQEDLQQYKAEVDSQFSEVKARFGDLQKIDLLPTAKDFQALALSIKEMEGDLKGMNSKMDGLSHATTRLERAVDMFTEASMERPR